MLHRKLWPIAVMLLGVLLASFAGQPRALAAPGKPAQVLSVKLPLLLDEGSLRGMQSSFISKGNRTHFGVDPAKDLSTHDFVVLTLHIQDDSATAEGHVSLAGISFNLNKLSGNVNKQDNILVVSLFGNAKTKRGEEEVAVALLYNPTTPDDSFASLTVGAMDRDQGTAVVVFGKRPAPMLTRPQSAQKTPVPSGSGGASIMATSEYTHVTSFSYDNVGQSNCACSEPGSYSWVGGVVSLDIFQRDPAVNGNGSGSAQVRMYSYSTNVSNYASATYNTPNAYFDVDSGWIRFREYDTTKGYINTNSWYPKASDLSASYNRWSWLGKIPKIGSTLTMVANYSIKQTAPVKVTTSSTNGRVNNVLIQLQSLGTDADYPGTDISKTYQQTDGGVTGWFDYLEYAGGTHQLYAEGRLRYFGWTSDLGYIYLWTRWAGTYWDANFLT